MSDQGEPVAEQLQFDEAEYADPEGSAPACAACKQGIAEEYHTANGAIVCGACRQLIADALDAGSGTARFLRASLYGFGAAVAGFAIYFGVMKLTGYEVGLISILVGFMVGAAVRAGSRGRGGWLYQLLAMFLVYSAIVVSYGSTAVLEMIEQAKVEKAPEQAVAKVPAQPGAPVRQAADAAKPAEAGAVAPTPGQLILGLLMVVGFFYALPVIVGTQAPIGLLIVGFALWEAWKINRKTPIVFTGPYRVGDEGGPLPQAAPGHA